MNRKQNTKETWILIHAKMRSSDQWELERPQSSSPPSHTNCDILALSETWLNLPETLEARHQKEENYALR